MQQFHQSTVKQSFTPKILIMCNSKFYYPMPYVMRAIILAFRGGNGYAPAIGNANRIHEYELATRIFTLYNFKPNNKLICSAIRDLRRIALTTPTATANGAVCWYIKGSELDGTPFEFAIRANDFICGGKEGRYLPANADELQEYQKARLADAENQLANAEAAARAKSYF